MKSVSFIAHGFGDGNETGLSILTESITGAIVTIAASVQFQMRITVRVTKYDQTVYNDSDSRPGGGYQPGKLCHENWSEQGNNHDAASR